MNSSGAHIRDTILRRDIDAARREIFYSRIFGQQVFSPQTTRFNVSFFALITNLHISGINAAQFRAARQSRLLWVVLVVGGFVLQPLGFLASIVYVTVIRPKVDRAAVPPAWGQPAQ